MKTQKLIKLSCAILIIANFNMMFAQAQNNNNSLTGNNAESTVRAFIVALGKQDYQAAYQFTNGIWGNYEKFSAKNAFGGITRTTIEKIKQMPDQNGKSVIYVEALYYDPVNGDIRVSENFMVGKISSKWYITGLKVLKVVTLPKKIVVENSNKYGEYSDERDGKEYKTVNIGTQTWFAENLAYDVDDDCWAYDNDENNVTKYGRLYNWETSQTVCPTGWHLPTVDEWTTLTDYIGGKTTDWELDAGINVLPAGARTSDGSFFGLGTGAGFWTSTILWDGAAGFQNIGDYHGEADRGDFDFGNGYCIRCVKD
jgi:uncharacterized protein (TIGR02145 family)